MQSTQSQSPNVVFCQFGTFWPRSGPFEISQAPNYRFHLNVAIGALEEAQLGSAQTEQVKSDL